MNLERQASSESTCPASLWPSLTTDSMSTHEFDLQGSDQRQAVTMKAHTGRLHRQAVTKKRHFFSGPSKQILLLRSGGMYKPYDFTCLCQTTLSITVSTTLAITVHHTGHHCPLHWSSLSITLAITVDHNANYRPSLSITIRQLGACS